MHILRIRHSIWFYLLLCIAYWVLAGEFGCRCEPPLPPVERVGSELKEEHKGEHREALDEPVWDGSEEYPGDTLIMDKQPEMGPEWEGVGSPFLPPRMLCRDISQAMCASMDSCCRSKWSQVLPWKTRTACEQGLRSVCLRDMYHREKAIYPGGFLVASTSHFNTCISTFSRATARCAVLDVRSFHEACGQVYSDPAQIGTRCLSDLGGLSCAQRTGICLPDEHALAYVCTALGQKGSRCEDVPCQKPLRCIRVGEEKICASALPLASPCTGPHQCVSPYLCIAKTCQKPLSHGAPCARTAECASGWACDPMIKRCVKMAALGSSCSFSGHCGEQGRCKGIAASAARCQKPVSERGACLSHEECDTALFCNTGRCVQRRSDTSSCFETRECQLRSFCHPSRKVCIPRTTRGAACVQGTDACVKPFVCLQQKGKWICSEQKKEGEVCTQNDECERGLLCHQGRCVQLPQEDKPCLASQCAKGLFCALSSMLCRPTLSQGSLCHVGNECGAQQACLPNSKGVHQCVPLPSHGALCRMHCADGWVCRSSVQSGSCVPRLCLGQILPR